MPGAPRSPAERRRSSRLPGLTTVSGVVLAVTALAIGAWWTARNRSAVAPADAGTHAQATPAAEFVGSPACATCHSDEADAWRTSHHARAMQPASDTTVLGDFSGIHFTGDGQSFTFLERDGRYRVRTRGADGELGEFEVRYTFGVDPLQQYLLDIGGGRLQALTVAWDSRPAEAGGQRWFSLYPGEDFRPGDEMHWSGRQHTWNFMCADCHSTDLRRGYDAAADSFDTRWSEVSVGCEACHGPGSRHVQWAEEGAGEGGPALTVVMGERRGVGWTTDPATGLPRRSAPPGARSEVTACAQCHSRRAQIAEGYVAGAPLLDHYLPELIEPGLYHPDGQQRDEVFTWGSFVQSRMFAAGVTCADCHEPHSGALRAEGNALCASCHTPERFDTPEHHFHAPEGEGARCVSCHMPSADFMRIDERRDHGMRIPRPDLSAETGAPHACTACHSDHSPEWAASTLVQWHGEADAARGLFARAFAAHEAGEPGVASALAQVAVDADEPPIIRASALARLSTVPAAVAIEAVRAGLGDADPLVRRSALRALEAAAAPERQVALAAPLLTDPVRGVRIQAAWVVAPAWASLPDMALRAAFERASDEFIAAQRLMANRSEHRVTLGSYFQRLGRRDEAEAEFRAALRLRPEEAAAYVNLADLMRLSGREGDAERLLRDALARLPGDAALHHALGLSLARSGRAAEATEEIGRAARAAPDEPRFSYAYAVALHSGGDRIAAMEVLEAALARHPADYDLLYAAATFQRDAGRRAEAHAYALRLREAHPYDVTALRLEEGLR